MPKTRKDGGAKKSEIPDTLRRSGEKAQRTFTKAYDSAIEQYDGDEERAHRVAWSAVKENYEKDDDQDRWVAK